MLEAVSLEVLGSCKDIIAEVTAQVLAASDIARTCWVGTESTWKLWNMLMLTPRPLFTSGCSPVNLDGLSSHLPGSNWGWGAPGTMSYLVPILHYKSTDPWVGYTPTSQALVRGPGWKPPLDFFDSNSQGLSHLGKLGLTDPECGSIMARVLERGRQRKS